jgi:hypothetical protein
MLRINSFWKYLVLLFVILTPKMQLADKLHHVIPKSDPYIHYLIAAVSLTSSSLAPGRL